MLAYSQLYPGDVTFLDSLESYLRKLNVSAYATPQERLTITEQARSSLYSYDAQCLPRVAEKILEADMEVDQEARGLWIAFSNHVMDPIFVDIMMQFLRSRNDPALNGMIGALLSKVIDKHISANWSEDKKKKDKKLKDAAETDDALPDFEEVKHIQAAIEELLGPTANSIQVRCGNLTHPEALFIASCLAMNSQKTLKEILATDLPITADIFGNLRDPDPVIKGSLKLLKADIPTKPTANQTAFLESLKRWIYTMLEKIPGGTTVCYQYLVGVYGSVNPDVSPYYIQIKDCGTMYTNLLTVAKQIVNK